MATLCIFAVCVTVINISKRIVVLVCLLSNTEIVISKKRPKIVITMLYSIFFILKNKLVPVAERKHKRLTWFVSYIITWSDFPWNRGKASNFFSKFSLTKCQCIWYIVTFLVKLGNIKLIFWGFVQQFTGFYNFR